MHHFFGNGKRHCTPSPEGLRKIKRISFETFICLKELLRFFKKRQNLKPRRHSDKPIVVCNKKNFIEPVRAYSYEPTQIGNAYDSVFWQWRRVIQWERYINDPLEKIKTGTM